MNIETATEQELFDTAVRGLASQKWKQSINVQKDCLLRGPNNRMCAIGWCMDDVD